MNNTLPIKNRKTERSPNIDMLKDIHQLKDDVRFIKSMLLKEKKPKQDLTITENKDKKNKKEKKPILNIKNTKFSIKKGEAGTIFKSLIIGGLILDYMKDKLVPSLTQSLSKVIVSSTQSLEKTLIKPFSSIFSGIKNINAKIIDLGNLTKSKTAAIKQPKSFNAKSISKDIKASKNIKKTLSKINENEKIKIKPTKTGTVLEKSAKFLKKAALPLTIGITAYDTYKDYKNAKSDKDRKQAFSKNIGGAAGAWAGAEIGATAGAAVGSFIPVVGTFIGGLLGGIVGGTIGWFSGSKIGNYVEKLLFSDIDDDIPDKIKEKPWLYRKAITKKYIILEKSKRKILKSGDKKAIKEFYKKEKEYKEKFKEIDEMIPKYVKKFNNPIKFYKSIETINNTKEKEVYIKLFKKYHNEKDNSTSQIKTKQTPINNINTPDNKFNNITKIESEYERKFNIKKTTDGLYVNNTKLTTDDAKKILSLDSKIKSLYDDMDENYELTGEVSDRRIKKLKTLITNSYNILNKYSNISQNSNIKYKENSDISDIKKLSKINNKKEKVIVINNQNEKIKNTTDYSKNYQNSLNNYDNNESVLLYENVVGY